MSKVPKVFCCAVIRWVLREVLSKDRGRRYILFRNGGGTYCIIYKLMFHLMLQHCKRHAAWDMLICFGGICSASPEPMIR